MKGLPYFTNESEKHKIGAKVDELIGSRCKSMTALKLKYTIAINNRFNWTFDPLNNYEFTFWSHKL